MSMFRLAALSVLAVVLAGCASNPNEMSFQKQFLSEAKARFAKNDATANQRAAIESMSRKQLSGIGDNPTILIDLETLRQYGTLFQISKNGDSDVFMTFDNKTITFEHGVMVATRGLGADLMWLDATETLAAMKSRTVKSTTTKRIHKTLDGENRATGQVFDCRYKETGRQKVVSVHKQFNLTRITEDCASESKPGAEYSNEYWVDIPTGIIWKSRQWAGPVIGYLAIDVLIPAK